MTMPYYASPEQLMRDRSEYARKGISRGRSVAVLTYADGVLFIAENPSSTLHKVGEIYDRIGFAAVGSGSLFAKNSLKKTWRPGLTGDVATRTIIEALYDAADDDSATGGPDPVRRLYPIVYRVDAEGAVRLADDEVAAVAEAIVADRSAAEREA